MTHRCKSGGGPSRCYPLVAFGAQSGGARRSPEPSAKFPGPPEALDCWEHPSSLKIIPPHGPQPAKSSLTMPQDASADNLTPLILQPGPALILTLCLCTKNEPPAAITQPGVGWEAPRGAGRSQVLPTTDDLVWFGLIRIVWVRLGGGGGPRRPNLSGSGRRRWRLRARRRQRCS